jgi:hypothetical protein
MAARGVSLLSAIALALLAGCGSKHEADVYFLHGYLAPLGYRGQLLAVKREARSPRDVVAALLRGATPAERRRGLISVIPRGTRIRSVQIRRRTAIVDFTRERPRDFDAAAQFVYSLAELPGVDWVALRFRGRPCCFYSHTGTPIARVRPEEDSFRWWQGEPCALRTSPDQAKCKRKTVLVPGRFERPGLEGNLASAGPVRGGQRPRARCAGEGAIVDGVRYFRCRLTWPDGSGERSCIGASPAGAFSYLPLRRC